MKYYSVHVLVFISSDGKADDTRFCIEQTMTFSEFDLLLIS